MVPLFVAVPLTISEPVPVASLSMVSVASVLIIRLLQLTVPVGHIIGLFVTSGISTFSVIVGTIPEFQLDVLIQSESVCSSPDC